MERSVIMGVKSKEQLLKEMAEVQGMLQERIRVQGQLIKNYQLLLSKDGLFSQIIDLFPYPIAIFTPQYTLTIANKAFAEEIKSLSANSDKKADRILKYKINDTRIASAVTRVFSGETVYLEDIKNPFSMFPGVVKRNASASGHYSRAVIFPVPADGDTITHGVIVFMP